MDDLTAFVNARLDEDGATHRHAGEGRIAWLTYRLDNGELSHTTVAADHHDGYWHAGGKLLPEPASVLIVYDQARVLREVAALRWLAAFVYVGGSEKALRHLAAVWSDHPDYRQEWAAW